MYVEKESDELNLARTITWGDSPTFSKNIFELSSIIGIGVLKNLDTYTIKMSEFDKVLEYKKTSENFLKFWKNKHLNEIGVRNDYFSTVSTVYDSFSGLIPPKGLEIKKNLFKENMLKNWIELHAKSTGIVLPPITGFDIIKKPKSKLEQFLEDLSANFEIINWFTLKGIFVEISNQKPDFINRSQKIISEAKEFFTNKGITTHGVIVGDIDYEDEEIQNIKIIFSIQDLDVSENLELSKELITYLAGIDKDALSDIKIQLQST